MTFAFASIFSGIGGFESGITPHGGECVFASEIDKFARTSYEALYGVVPHGDITQIASEDIPHHDLLVGGPPCQAFSVAGNKSGMRAECSSCGHQTVLTFEQYADRDYTCTDCYSASLDIVDDRGLLFFEMARIAKDKKPKAVLIENVKGLVRHDKGRTLRTWLTTLSGIGYAIDFKVLNSVDFQAAQTRERVYIVGLLSEPASEWENVEGATVVPAAKRELKNDVRMFNFEWPAEQGEYKSLRSVLEDRVDERFFITEDKTVSILGEASASQDITYSPVLTPDRVNRRQCGPRFRGSEEPAYTVTTQDRHGVVVPRQPEMVGLLDIKGHDIIRRVYDQSAPGPTVTTMGGGNREPKVKLGNRIRKLTPLECWRLQGFTDEQFYKAKNAGLSNSQLYKQAGNAVTVNVIDAIMQNLKTYVQEADLIDIF